MSSRTGLLLWFTFLPSVHGWAGGAHPISGYFWLCTKVEGAELGCCPLLYLSGSVLHGVGGYLVWERIPIYPRSSCFRILHQNQHLGLTPCFLVCQRNLLPRSNDWGIAFWSSNSFFVASLFSGSDRKKWYTSMVKKEKRKSWKRVSWEEGKKKGELSFRQVVESGTNDKWELKACCKCIRGSLLLVL